MPRSLRLEFRDVRELTVPVDLVSKLVLATGTVSELLQYAPEIVDGGSIVWPVEDNHVVHLRWATSLSSGLVLELEGKPEAAELAKRVDRVLSYCKEVGIQISSGD